MSPPVTHSGLRPRLLWCWPEFLKEISELVPVLERFADVEAGCFDQRELMSKVQFCDILVPRMSHTIDREVLEAAPRLRLIGTPSTGSDHIAVAEANARGVRVITLKDERQLLDSIPATAEHAWLLIQACHRRLRPALRQVELGHWEPQAIRGHELMGRTVGIIGYGRLGGMISRFARAFGMNVLGCDPHVTIEDPWVRQVALQDLVKEADVISVHVHLTAQTRGLLGRDEFAAMKPGVILVNTSRGAVIDEASLLESLNEGKMFAAGLDVIDGERAADLAQHPLIRYAAEHDNLIITPHIGGCTVESQAKAVRHLAHRLQEAWPTVERRQSFSETLS
jgi:D-3-phosphoglycerate dehydrogenase